MSFWPCLLFQQHHASLAEMRDKTSLILQNFTLILQNNAPKELQLANQQSQKSALLMTAPGFIWIPVNRACKIKDEMWANNNKKIYFLKKNIGYLIQFWNGKPFSKLFCLSKWNAVDMALSHPLHAALSTELSRCYQQKDGFASLLLLVWNQSFMFWNDQRALLMLLRA